MRGYARQTLQTCRGGPKTKASGDVRNLAHPLGAMRFQNADRHITEVPLVNARPSLAVSVTGCSPALASASRAGRPPASTRVGLPQSVPGSYAPEGPDRRSPRGTLFRYDRMNSDVHQVQKKSSVSSRTPE